LGELVESSVKVLKLIELSSLRITEKQNKVSNRMVDDVIQLPILLL